MRRNVNRNVFNDRKNVSATTSPRKSDVRFSPACQDVYIENSDILHIFDESCTFVIRARNMVRCITITGMSTTAKYVNYYGDISSPRANVTKYSCTFQNKKNNDKKHSFIDN